MKMQKLHCRQGHDWERKPSRGKPPVWCDKHKPAPVAKGTATMQVLHCELGNHDWSRESKRGRKPRNCPKHEPKVESSGVDGLTAARAARSAKAEAKRADLPKERKRWSEWLAEERAANIRYKEDYSVEAYKAWSKILAAMPKVNLKETYVPLEPIEIKSEPERIAA